MVETWKARKWGGAARRSIGGGGNTGVTMSEGREGRQRASVGIITLNQLLNKQSDWLIQYLHSEISMGPNKDAQLGLSRRDDVAAAIT